MSEEISLRGRAQNRFSFSRVERADGREGRPWWVGVGRGAQCARGLPAKVCTLRSPSCRSLAVGTCDLIWQLGPLWRACRIRRRDTGAWPSE